MGSVKNSHEMGSVSVINKIHANYNKNKLTNMCNGNEVVLAIKHSITAADRDSNIADEKRVLSEGRTRFNTVTHVGFQLRMSGAEGVCVQT
jgi:hypothetical protein